MPETLPIPQLGRFIGRMVECDVKHMTGKWMKRKHHLLTVAMLGELTVGHSIRNIRPVLRELSTLTEAEARECFRLAFPEGALGKVETCTDTVTVVRDNEKRLVIYSTYMAANSCQTGRAWDFNAVAVIDYLDELCVDIRGYLKAGLAVKQEE